MEDWPQASWLPHPDPILPARFTRKCPRPSLVPVGHPPQSWPVSLLGPGRSPCDRRERITSVAHSFCSQPRSKTVKKRMFSGSLFLLQESAEKDCFLQLRRSLRVAELRILNRHILSGGVTCLLLCLGPSSRASRNGLRSVFLRSWESFCEIRGTSVGLLQHSALKCYEFGVSFVGTG